MPVQDPKKLDKLGADRFGPFVVPKLIGWNEAKPDLLEYLKMHLVTKVSHTKTHVEQPGDIASRLHEKPALTPAEQSDEYILERRLTHRCKERAYKFLTLISGDLLHAFI